MRYLSAYARDNYAEAISALDQCLADPGGDWDAPQIADLLRRKGDLLFMQGRIDGAAELYCAAEKADPTSLLVKCIHARFLLEKVGDRQGAIRKCEEVIAAATEQPFPETDDDFSSEYYRSLAAEIKISALRSCE
jgi:tetratricopeptide (TPR) repeat protein